MKQESYYGYFHGGDPRDFHPDSGDCTPEELENHRKACEFANQHDAGRKLQNPSCWQDLGNGNYAHVLKAPFGIGVGTYEVETVFESDDADHCDPDEFEE